MDQWDVLDDLYSYVYVSHLSHGVGQDVDDLLVGRGHHALAVDLDDAVAHADPAPLGDAPAHKATDLLNGIGSF